MVDKKISQNKRIVLKVTQGDQKPDCKTFINIIFGKFDIALISLITVDTPTGYTALYHTENDADQLISEKASFIRETLIYRQEYHLKSSLTETLFVGKGIHG